MQPEGAIIPPRRRRYMCVNVLPVLCSHLVGFQQLLHGIKPECTSVAARLAVDHAHLHGTIPPAHAELEMLNHMSDTRS